MVCMFQGTDLNEEVPGPETCQPRYTALVHRLQVLQRRERWRRAELLDGRVRYEPHTHDGCIRLVHCVISTWVGNIEIALQSDPLVV